jgi:hypothetical protein
MHDPLVIDELMAGTAYMVHDFVVPVLLKGLPDPPGKIIQNLVPSHSLPFSLASLAYPFQRKEYPLGIVDLIDGGRSFCAVAAPAAGMCGVTLELANTKVFLVYVCKQAAACLTIETDSGNQHVAFFDPLGPMGRIILCPVIPTFRRWKTGQTSLWRFQSSCYRVKRLELFVHAVGSPQLSGTAWPALTQRSSNAQRPTRARIEAREVRI